MVRGPIREDAWSAPSAFWFPPLLASPSGCVSGLVAPTASEGPLRSGIALITPIRSLGMGREEG